MSMDHDDPPRATRRGLAGSLSALALAGFSLVLTLSLAVSGVLGGRAASVLAPMTFMAVVVCLWQSLRAAGIITLGRPLHRRHGFWLVLLLTLLALPQLGSFSLIDPWETHYAEVAREMSARGDFISTWWGQEGWFMSKPVSSFWLEALSMRALGAQTAPGQVLSGPAGHFAHPEWAVRWPGFLFMLVGCYLLYRGVSAGAGRHAGMLVGIVLATAAQWVLASRQALTDTPFVGALTAGFGLLLWGWSTPEAARTQRHQLGVGRVSITCDASWLLTALILCALVPQLLLLLFTPPLHAGSVGNCGLPSQPACAPVPLAHAWLSPALQAAVWSALLAPLVRSVTRERRTRRLLLLGGWYALGLATMAKGPAGFALPLTAAGVYLLLQGRLRELGRGELVRGGALLVLLVAPWYVAMYARHGRLIIDELVLRHMLGRALDHLHDTNAGDDVGFRYYVWQLGYAMFPWIGLVPAALLAATRARADRSESSQRVLDLALLWLVVSFSLFTFMQTKFHHYILPAVPALSVLTGLYLAELWHESSPRERHRAAVAHVLGLGGAILVACVGLDLVRPVRAGIPGSARLLHLLSYKYTRAWPAELDFTVPLLVFSAACSIITLLFGSARGRRGLIAAQVCAAVAFAGWLGQHYLVKLGPAFGQRHVIEAFYRDRSNSAEPLIAYQLNWKGENFYTGNRLAIFVSSGQPLHTYLQERRAAGDTVFHFVLETARLATLRAELGRVQSFELLTERQHSDKICLVRVELR